MDFCQLMNAVWNCDVELSNWMSPVNAEDAKQEFLQNPSLRRPSFEYERYDFSDKMKDLTDILSEIFAISTASDLLHPEEHQMLLKYALTVEMKLRVLDYMQQYRDLRDADDLSMVDKMGKMNRLRTWIYYYNQQLNTVPREDILRQLEDGSFSDAGFRPKPETVLQFRELIEDRWQKSLARIDMTRSEYTPEEVCDLVNAVLTEDLPFKTDFRAELNHKKMMMGIDQTRHVFDVPVHRANGKYTPKVIRAKVLGHETFGHLYRADFMHGIHPELAITLPPYGIFEEGVTKCIEQALGDGYALSGEESYLIAGWAYCDRLEFRDVFQKYCDFRLARNSGKPLSEKTMGVIFQRVTRAFSGTGNIPWSSGTLYFNGPCKVWPYIERGINEPKKLWRRLFETGKTDPTLPEHQNLLIACYEWTDENFRFG